MSRYQLEQMYLDVYGEGNVNETWLAVMSDEEIMSVITAYAILGRTAELEYRKCADKLLRSSVATAKRDREQRKSEQENS